MNEPLLCSLWLLLNDWSRPKKSEGRRLKKKHRQPRSRKKEGREGEQRHLKARVQRVQTIPFARILKRHSPKETDVVIKWMSQLQNFDGSLIEEQEAQTSARGAKCLQIWNFRLLMDQPFLRKCWFDLCWRNSVVRWSRKKKVVTWMLLAANESTQKNFTLFG